METKTLTLAEFLLARIAEDEAVARTAEPTWPDDPGLRIVKVEEEGSPAEIVVSPERLLAECEAKRRIVGLAAEQPQVFAEAVTTLAEVYADHPDYRQEWRP